MMLLCARGECYKQAKVVWYGRCLCLWATIKKTRSLCSIQLDKSTLSRRVGRRVKSLLPRGRYKIRCSTNSPGHSVVCFHKIQVEIRVYHRFTGTGYKALVKNSVQRKHKS